MEAKAIEKIVEKQGKTLRSFDAIHGGDINEAFLLQTDDAQFFLKANSYSDGLEMLEAEALGLSVIANTNTVATPEIFDCGKEENCHYLLLAYHDSESPSKKFWYSFGEQLAALHKHSDGQYGWPAANYIGRLVQPNGKHHNWVDFFVQERLMPQVAVASKQNLLTAAAQADFKKLYTRLPDILPEDGNSLTHGDLWSGNFICGKGQNLILIDPASAYSHREMDLAMSKLFGGFDALFYEAYLVNFPCAPGLEERLKVLQLYYLLVHLNLFGPSYWPAIHQILRKFS